MVEELLLALLAWAGEHQVAKAAETQMVFCLMWALEKVRLRNLMVLLCLEDFVASAGAHLVVGHGSLEETAVPVALPLADFAATAGAASPELHLLLAAAPPSRAVVSVAHYCFLHSPGLEEAEA